MVSAMSVFCNVPSDTRVVVRFHDGSSTDVTRWLSALYTRGSLPTGASDDAVPVGEAVVIGAAPEFWDEGSLIPLDDALARIASGVAAALEEGINAER
jgi:hypothetical protein